jgi:hypothetical protein
MGVLAPASLFGLALFRLLIELFIGFEKVLRGL